MRGDVDHRVPSCAQQQESPDEYLNMAQGELLRASRIFVEEARRTSAVAQEGKIEGFWGQTSC